MWVHVEQISMSKSSTWVLISTVYMNKCLKSKYISSLTCALSTCDDPPHFPWQKCSEGRHAAVGCECWESCSSCQSDVGECLTGHYQLLRLLCILSKWAATADTVKVSAACSRLNRQEEICGVTSGCCWWRPVLWPVHTLSCLTSYSLPGSTGDRDRERDC